MDKEWLALEAKRLRDDPVFSEALTRLRSQALEKLATVKSDDQAAILSLQATVTVCDGIRQEVEAMILSKEDRKPIRAV
jgi:hypothetical protein